MATQTQNYVTTCILLIAIVFNGLIIKDNAQRWGGGVGRSIHTELMDNTTIQRIRAPVHCKILAHLSNL